MSTHPSEVSENFGRLTVREVCSFVYIRIRPSLVDFPVHPTILGDGLSIADILVQTKTQGLFQRRLDRYHADQVLLKTVDELLQSPK